MKEIKLNNNLKLSFELLDKRMRLIVSDNDKELACRKETIISLKQFLLSEDSNLFKGRLRLSKKGEQIQIIIKNEAKGICSINQFEQALNEI